MTTDKLTGLAFILAIVISLFAISMDNASAGSSYTNTDTRFGKITKSHKLLGINKHSYRIVKR